MRSILKHAFAVNRSLHVIVAVKRVRNKASPFTVVMLMTSYTYRIITFFDISRRNSLTRSAN